jgi:hypothetical protein
MVVPEALTQTAACIHMHCLFCCICSRRLAGSSRMGPWPQPQTVTEMVRHGYLFGRSSACSSSKFSCGFRKKRGTNAEASRCFCVSYILKSSVLCVPPKVVPAGFGGRINFFQMVCSVLKRTAAISLKTNEANLLHVDRASMAFSRLRLGDRWRILPKSSCKHMAIGFSARSSLGALCFNQLVLGEI